MNTEKQKLIPTLRFPEFQNTGAWKRLELGELIQKNTLKNKKLKYSLVQSVSNKFGFINQNQYFENRRIASKETSNYYIIKKGDFAYNPSRINVGSLAYKSDNEISIISPLYVSFRANKELLDDIFLLNWFSTEDFSLQMQNSTRGGVRDTLNYDSLIKINISIPPLEEQAKIADCLSSLDDVIAAQTRKLMLLKKHKKGLLQQLFPAENQTTPTLRFPEFQNAGAWEEKKIKSIGEVITGGTPSKKQNEFWNGDFVWITAQDFNSKYISNSVLKLSKKGKNKSRVIPVNSILVTCIASIGLNAINKVECATNQQINSIICNYDYYFEFIYYAILTNIKRLKNLAGQTAVPIINKSVFENFIISFPKNKQEQAKIADCLSSLDDVIAAQTKKIATLKNHKKGLLQQLFPKIKV